MTSVRLFSVMAVAAVAMLCLSVLTVQSTSAEGVDNDQGTVTYYTYTVNFQFQGTDAQSILWEFGFNDADGNPVTSTEWNPSGIVFPAKGTYTVIQTVSNSVGSYVSQLKICIMGTPEISFDSTGGTSVEKQTVKVGNKVSEPSAPVKDGLIFAGWFKEPSLLNRYDFSQTVTQHMTLYAKWVSPGTLDTGGGNDGKDDGGDDDKNGSDASDTNQIGLNNSTVSIAAVIVGILMGIFGNRGESKTLLYIGIIIALAGAACLFTGYDIIGTLGIGEEKR